MRMQEARRDAIARRESRRRPQLTKTWSYADGRTQEYVENDGLPPYLPPENLADWCDDRLAVMAQYRGSFSEVTVAVLEAARTDGERAACGALRPAKKLMKGDQYRLVTGDLQALRNAAGGLPAARQLVAALTREASRLHLAERRPGFAEAELDEYSKGDKRNEPRPGSGRLEPVPAMRSFELAHGLA